MTLNSHPEYEFSIDHLGLDSKKGLHHILFYPILNAEMMEEYHDLYFTNANDEVYLYDFSLQDQTRLLWRERGILPPRSFHFIGRMACSWLNEKPQLLIELTEKKSDGSGKTLQSQIILKAKLYAKKSIQLNENKHAYLFEVHHLTAKEKINKQKPSYEIIRSTKSNDDYQSYDQYHYIGMPNELDLHAETLNIDVLHLQPKEILELQLSAFGNYMEKVMIANFDFVYIIHGIGKGRLKEQIHLKLKNMAEVSSFVNEYHPKYGWGATQVFFKY